MGMLKRLRYRVSNVTSLLFGFIPIGVVLMLLAVAGKRGYDKVK